MTRRASVRKVPGAVVLGLLASLAGHAALYGGAHAVGGTYHVVLLQIALAAALGFVALVGALAWTQSGRSSDGSVLAARLRERLPGVGGVIVAAAGWYVAIEAIEPHHAGAPAFAVLAALPAASYAVLRIATAIIAGLARAVIAIFHTSFSPRTPTWRRRPRPRPIARRLFSTRRRFARPPPIALGLPRA